VHEFILRLAGRCIRDVGAAHARRAVGGKHGERRNHAYARRGGPYRRQDAVFSTEVQSSPFSAVFQEEMGTGVTVAQVLEDQSAPDMRYQPGHPDANADGYVAYPKMNPAEEMVDLLNSSRSYQANVAAMTAVKDMIGHSLDIMK
jgi:flagellar basal-body rod protein FlgC